MKQFLAEYQDKFQNNKLTFFRFIVGLKRATLHLTIITGALNLAVVGWSFKSRLTLTNAKNSIFLDIDFHVLYKKFCPNP